MLPTSSRSRRLLTLVVAATGLSLLLWALFSGLTTLREGHSRSELEVRIDRINRSGLESVATAELEQLIEQAGEQGIFLPEADYAVLYRQWQQILSLFNGFKALLDNPYLVERAHRSAADFHRHLQQFNDAVAERLRHPDMPSAWQWKLYTLRGNASVLLAYSVLYQEQDGRKAAKLLSDALDDYKTAIQQVDQVSLSSLERALPRWNLELIVAVGEYRRLGLSQIGPSEIRQVQEQLQTYIPEAPGFSPGAPIETRVEK